MTFSLDAGRTGDKRIRDLQKKLASAREYRRNKSFVGQDGEAGRWKRCYNYYVGNQWKKTTSAGHPKIVVNICLNLVDSVLSSLLAQSPTPYVVPVTDNPLHAQQCESLTAAYAAWQEDKDAQRPFRLGLKNTFIYGTNHFKIRWDKQISDVSLAPVSPFSIFHDPHATSLQDCEWLIQGRVLNVERVRRLSATENFQEADAPQDLRQDDDKKKDTAYVYEAWLDGGERMLWCTEDKVILEAPNPYRHGKFPYVRLVDIELPDEYEGLSTIEVILSLQAEINEIHSQRVIFSRYHTYPWTMVEIGALQNRKTLTNEPNQILDVRPGMEVKRDWAPAMPQHLLSLPESANLDAQRVVGINETPQGRRPSPVTSGRGLEAIASIQSQRLEGLKARPFEQAIKEIARQIISLMIQHYRGPRIATFWKETEMMQMQIPNVLPDIPFSIRVEPGASLAVNKVARVQMALQLAMLGKISDEELFRAIEWPRWREAAKQAQEQRMTEILMGNQMGQPGMGGNGRAPSMGGPGVPRMGRGPLGPSAGQGIGNPLQQLSQMPISGLVGTLGQMMRGQGMGGGG